LIGMKSKGEEKQNFLNLKKKFGDLKMDLLSTVHFVA